MSILITGLDQIITFKKTTVPLTGRAMRDINIIKSGAILIDEKKIVAIGKEREMKKHKLVKNAKHIKMRGVALPGFVDSHTHAIFAEPRLRDFSLRVSGSSYQEIKTAGGGIISSIKALRKQSPIEMEKQLLGRAKKFLEYGTTTAEVKTGYGLDFKYEVKMLEVLKKAAQKTSLEMPATLLSAHSVPPEFKGNTKKYLEFIIAEILPFVAKKKLAIFVDIFCEKGYFGAKESFAYLSQAKKFGFIGKIHAEQLSSFGGIAAGVCAGAISADHADYANLADIKVAAQTGMILTLLPASNFYLGISKYPNARKMIDLGVAIALATDFNPGTSPCWNMQEVLSLASINMGMTPEESIVASTINGAYALNMADKTGSLEVGKQADIAIFDAEDYREISYYFGGNLNLMTVKKGKIVYESKNYSL